MRSLFTALAAVLLTACATANTDKVTINTPTTPPEGSHVAGTSTPAPTSANTVDPVPQRLSQPDTTHHPAWLQARIQATLGHRKQNPTIRIFRYNYKGQTVYWETAPCCDQYSNLFDTKGRVICQPDGGITGKGDGKCPDFDKNKTDEKLVWQDPR